jgi:hypothetical protein
LTQIQQKNPANAYRAGKCRKDTCVWLFPQLINGTLIFGAKYGGNSVRSIRWLICLFGGFDVKPVLIFKQSQPAWWCIANYNDGALTSSPRHSLPGFQSAHQLFTINNHQAMPAYLRALGE